MVQNYLATTLLQETANGLTKLSADAGPEINEKKTAVMTNDADTYIKMKGEIVKCVPECTYRARLVNSRDKSGKENQERDWNSNEKVSRSYGVN
jgi:hypothetical protein